MSLKNPEDLNEFRNICTQAKILATTPHGRSLIALDCEDMQKTVVSRMNHTLKMQWAKKHAKIAKHSPERTVLFRDFCTWIEEISSVSQSCESCTGVTI